MHPHTQHRALLQGNDCFSQPLQVCGWCSPTPTAPRSFNLLLPVHPSEHTRVSESAQARPEGKTRPTGMGEAKGSPEGPSFTHPHVPHGTQRDHQQLPEPTSSGASSHGMTFFASCPSPGGFRSTRRGWLSHAARGMSCCHAKQLVEHEAWNDNSAAPPIASQCLHHADAEWGSIPSKQRLPVFVYASAG